MFSYFETFPNLEAIFTGAALLSYIEDVLVIVVTLIVGVPLMIVLSRTKFFQQEK
ncbi:MAG TPA: hypothetical protein VJ529_00055 [Candidatus Bathyarchaeia archaeon]|nr:hypothetical protein [Candidatus Bathyarchaeia archaeon]